MARHTQSKTWVWKVSLLLSLSVVAAATVPVDTGISGLPRAHRPQLARHGSSTVVMTADAAAAMNAAPDVVIRADRDSPPTRADESAATDVTAAIAAAAAEAASNAASTAASDAIATAHVAAELASMPWSRFRAVTVVHEPCSTLSYTLTNFAGNLGPDWPILLIYTPRAKDAVLDNKVVRYMARYGALHTLPLSALAVPGLDELTTVVKYSQLLARPEFWEAVHAEKALIFQTDSVLCSMSEFSIDDFLAFDYVGAPWVHVDHAVGNGGLSLRSVDKMLHITRHFKRSPHPEDVFFVEGLAAMAFEDATSVIRAPTAIAKRFAWEMDEDAPNIVPFGVHRSVVVPAETKAAIIASCPEAAAGVWTACGRGG